MHRPTPPPYRPCRQRMTLFQAVGAGLLDWPLRRIGFCLAVVAALLALRPVVLETLRCSPSDWSICREVR